jgi:hypothetical protein
MGAPDLIHASAPRSLKKDPGSPLGLGQVKEGRPVARAPLRFYTGKRISQPTGDSNAPS